MSRLFARGGCGAVQECSMFLARQHSNGKHRWLASSLTAVTCGKQYQGAHGVLTCSGYTMTLPASTQQFRCYSKPAYRAALSPAEGTVARLQVGVSANSPKRSRLMRSTTYVSRRLR